MELLDAYFVNLVVLQHSLWAYMKHVPGASPEYEVLASTFCDFLYFFFFKIPSSKYHLTKSKPYIKILRHTSLQTDLSGVHTHFQAAKCFCK